LKKSITPEYFSQASHNLWHAHQHTIGIICSKFQLDKLITVAEIRDTYFTNRLTNGPTDRLSELSKLIGELSSQDSLYN